MTQIEKAEAAVTELTNVAMRALAVAIREATSSSPLARARVALGERFPDVACEHLRAHLKAMLADPETRESVLVPGPLAGLAAQAALAGVVADTLTGIIATAEVR